MYAQRLSAPSIEKRIVREINPERFREITDSTLEGLAKTRAQSRCPDRKSRLRPRSAGSSPRLSRTSLSPPGPSLAYIRPYYEGSRTSTGSARCPRHSPLLARKLEPRFRSARQDLPPRRIRQSPSRRRPHAGVGDPRASVVRGRAHRRSAARIGRPTAGCGLLRPALGASVPGRRLRRLDPGRTRQHAAPEAVRDPDRRRRVSVRPPTDPIPRCHPDP